MINAFCLKRVDACMVHVSAKFPGPELAEQVGNGPLWDDEKRRLKR